MQTPQDLSVVYRDEHLIAVAKPTGMFVHRTDENRTESHVVLQLVREIVGDFVFSIHRLDRATSGIVLLGLSADAAARMNKQFAERQVSKTYMALVRGHTPNRGVWDTPLVSSRGRGKPAEHPHAQPQQAETHFEAKQFLELPIACQRYSTTRSTLVEVKPRTGRFHQIRRHFNYASHPIIGDTSHGDSRHNALYREHFQLDRLMLAAVQLEFLHPFANKLLTIDCPPDRSFAGIMEKVRANADTASPDAQS